MQLKISYASAAFLSLHFVYADVYILTPGLPAPTATPSFKDEAEVRYSPSSFYVREYMLSRRSSLAAGMPRSAPQSMIDYIATFWSSLPAGWTVSRQ